MHVFMMSPSLRLSVNDFSPESGLGACEAALNQSGGHAWGVEWSEILSTVGSNALSRQAKTLRRPVPVWGTDRTSGSLRAKLENYLSK